MKINRVQNRIALSMASIAMLSGIAILSGIVMLSGISAFAASQQACKEESQYQEIDKGELTALIEKKQVFVIDVNSKESFDKQHIPGAIHFGSSKKSLATMLPKNKDALIVAYCGSTKCGAWKEAAIKACQMGYTNVRHFKPGIKGWTKG